MYYLLFLNHPKGEKVYKLNKTKEKRARKYFSTVSTIETEIDVRGKKIKALVDYNTLLYKYANFDCFNCQDPCCGDNPVIFEKKTRDFLLENAKRYNELTRNLDLLEEYGWEKTEIKDSIENDMGMIPEEFIGDEVDSCTCAYKPDNCKTLCSIHAIALEKNLNFKDIVNLKPLVCSLWPLEILVEEDMSQAYVTLPDDFTNNFTSEDYYKIGCINVDYSTSALFRKKNPEGFAEDGYIPFYKAYKDTLVEGLGEKFYKDLIAKY
ncbi:MAG: hypothetical protein ACRC0Y_06915 [Fusobacteriaceae bacterium]